jgi:hypothetical protein
MSAAAAAAAAAAGGGGGAAGGVAAGRVRQVPGFTGNNITNPTEFLESVLERLPGVPALFRAATGGGEAPTFVENNESSGNLINDDEGNKLYQTIPYLGMARVSASGADNCCFFDSFLFCMSPKYRKLSIPNREIVFKLFRSWCNSNSKRILATANKQMVNTLSETQGLAVNGGKRNLQLAEQSIEKDFTSKINAIGIATGWVIAWYFGVNLIYMYQNEYPGKNVNMSYPHYLIHCPTAYQSQDCKTIIIRQGVNHFESIGTVGITNNKLNESNSKFLYEWTDSRLCALKTFAKKVCQEAKGLLYKTWKFPEVCNDDNPSVLAAINELEIQGTGENAGAIAATELRRVAAERNAIFAAKRNAAAAGAVAGGGGGAAAGSLYKGGARKTRKHKKATRKLKRRNRRTLKKSKKTRRY